MSSTRTIQPDVALAVPASPDAPWPPPARRVSWASRPRPRRRRGAAWRGSSRDGRALSFSRGVVGVLHAAALGVHAMGRGLADALGLDPKRAIEQLDRLARALLLARRGRRAPRGRARGARDEPRARRCSRARPEARARAAGPRAEQRGRHGVAWVRAVEHLRRRRARRARRSARLDRARQGGPLDDRALPPGVARPSEAPALEDGAEVRTEEPPHPPGHFSRDEAVTKLLYLALRNIERRWSRCAREWSRVPRPVRCLLRTP